MFRLQDPTNPAPHSGQAHASHVPSPPPITPSEVVRRLGSPTAEEFDLAAIPWAPKLTLDTVGEPLLASVRAFGKSWMFRWLVNVREALNLFEEAGASHYKCCQILQDHIMDIFPSSAEFRAMHDCSAAVRASPIYYDLRALSRVPVEMRSPSRSGMFVRMKEKRDCCHRLVAELEFARLALERDHPGVLEEHDFAVQRPAHFQAAGAADPAAGPSIPGVALQEELPGALQGYQLAGQLPDPYAAGAADPGLHAGGYVFDGHVYDAFGQGLCLHLGARPAYLVFFLSSEAQPGTPPLATEYLQSVRLVFLSMFLVLPQTPLSPFVAALLSAPCIFFRSFCT